MRVNKLTAATLLFAGGLLLGRVLGALRDVVIVRLLGFSTELDAVVVALSIPEAITSIVVAGPAALALVPVLTAALRDDRMSGRRLATELLLLATTASLLVAIGLTVSADSLIGWMFPGLSSDQRTAAAGLMRLSSWIVPVTTFSYVCMPTLQAAGRWGLSAFSTAIFNAVLVAAAVALVPIAGAIGVIGASLTAAIVRAAAQGTQLAREGLLHITICVGDRRTYVMLPLVLVAAVSLALRDLLLVTDRVFASFLTPGTIASLTYAERLTQVPFCLFVGGAASALVPVMAADADPSERYDSLLNAMRLVFPPVAIAALVIVCCPEGITWLLFGSTAPADLVACLRMFAVGLPAQAVGALLTIYAFVTGRRSIAVMATLTAWAVSTAISQPLVSLIGATGLAAANVCAFGVQASVLAIRINAVSPIWKDGARIVAVTVRSILPLVATVFVVNGVLTTVASGEWVLIGKVAALAIGCASFMWLPHSRDLRNLMFARPSEG